MYALAVETKSYPLWVNKKLSIPWWSGAVASDFREIVFSWDPSETKIASAKLIIVAQASARTNLRLSINNNEAAYLRWEITEDQAQKTAESDVTQLLANGINLFTVEYWKDLMVPFDVTATFTATLIIEYEGSSPEERERTWLEKYWMYIAAGVAVVVLGGLSIAYAMRRGK
jgi:hypothetical protein